MPDNFTTSKGLGGGLFPVGAAVSTTPIWHDWTAGQLTPNPDTYAGSDLGCVVALAVFDVVVAPGYLDQVVASAEAFERGFDGIEGWTLDGFGLNRSLRPHLNRKGDSLALSQRVRNEGVFAIPSFDVPALLLRLPGVVTPDEATDIASRIRRAL